MYLSCTTKRSEAGRAASGVGKAHGYRRDPAEEAEGYNGRVEEASFSDDHLRAWGIERGYSNYKGEWQPSPDASVARALEAMGAQDGVPPSPRTIFRRAGRPLELPDGWKARSELGDLSLADPAPAGYHEAIAPDGSERRLVVSPGTCFLPEGLRTWGWALQLYSLRSRASWGIGDLADLRDFGAWTAERDGMVLINPLHCVAPGLPQESSPYYPGSRIFLNPIYVRIEDVPGAADLEELAALQRAGRALSEDRRIDRDEVYRLKRTGLEHLWEIFEGDDEFEAYVERRGSTLERFATYMAIADLHGPSWRAWPASLQRADGDEVLRFARSNRDRVRFHAWTQWLLEQQADAAAEAGRIVHDLAVGVDPDGADAWIWRDSFAEGVTAGAPPDDYARDGQDWAAAVWDPWGLDRSGFEPFIQTIRSSMAHGAGVRIDHVMALFRLFWVPGGTQPSEGVYVRYPADKLLDLLALESHMAGCIVVGEDLGTVEPHVRDEMTERAILRTALTWFEDKAASELPPVAMAATNTHDLPTTAGLWNGSDTKAQEEQGLDPNLEFKSTIVERLCHRLGVGRDAPVAEVVDRSYEALAGSPSAIVLGSVEDALEVEERHNQPGSVGPWNWSTALPAALEEIVQHPRVRRLASLLGRR